MSGAVIVVIDCRIISIYHQTMMLVASLFIYELAIGVGGLGINKAGYGDH